MGEGILTKVSKKICFLAFLLYYICAMGFSQAITPEENSASAATDVVPSDMSSAKAQESAIIIEQAQTPTVSPQAVSSTNSIWYFIRVILTLALVIAVIYGIVYLLKKSGNPLASSDPYLKKLASLPLSTGRTVYIISAGRQAFIVGSAESSLNLIAEITDTDLIDAMNLNLEKNTNSAKPKDFSSLISKFFPGVHTGSPDKTAASQEEVNISQAAAETAEFLRQHRERLHSANESETTGDRS